MQQKDYSFEPASLMPCPLGEASSFVIHLASPSYYILQGDIGSRHQWRYNFSSNHLTLSPKASFTLTVDVLNSTAFHIRATFDPLSEGLLNVITLLSTMQQRPSHILYSENIVFRRSLTILQPQNDSHLDAESLVEITYDTVQTSRQPAMLHVSCKHLLAPVTTVPQQHDARYPFLSIWIASFRLSRECPYEVWITASIAGHPSGRPLVQTIRIFVDVTAQHVAIHGPSTMYMTDRHNQLQCLSDSRPPLPVRWTIKPLPVYVNKESVSSFHSEGEDEFTSPSAPSSSVWVMNPLRNDILLLQNYIGSELLTQPAKGWGAVGHQLEFNVTCDVRFMDTRKKPITLSSSRIITVFTHSNESYKKTLEVVTYVLTGILFISIILLIVTCWKNRKRSSESREEPLSSKTKGHHASFPSHYEMYETQQQTLLRKPAPHSPNKSILKNCSQLKVESV